LEAMFLIICTSLSRISHFFDPATCAHVGASHKAHIGWRFRFQVFSGSLRLQGRSPNVDLGVELDARGIRLQLPYLCERLYGLEVSAVDALL
jgi:hypothetical protein